MNRYAKAGQIPDDTVAFVPAAPRKRRLRTAMASSASRVVAVIDRLNGSTPPSYVHDADYKHLMRVTDT